MSNFDPVMLALRVPAIFFSLTIHEFMHAWVAWKCGDDTARREGRVSLNPLVHLDPVGTILLFIAPIGWAKPVPVQAANFDIETRRRDEILVSIAGVAANFTLAVAVAMLARVLTWQGLVPLDPDIDHAPTLANFAWGIMGWLVFLHFGLAIFNLIPLPPLDGSHILRNLLPLNAAILYHEYRQYIFFGLIGLVVASSMGSYHFLSWPVQKLFELAAGPEAGFNLYINMVLGR
jgi:Zn-dependent protease